MPKEPTKITLVRSVNKKLDHYKSYESDKENVRTAFVEDRFEFCADDHHSSIVSGSTYSNPNDEKPDAVVGASASDFIYDTYNVRVGFVMATGDGLGHTDIARENESTALVTMHACEKLVDAAKKRRGKVPAQDIPKLFNEVGQDSKKSRLRYDVKDPAKDNETPYDSQSSHSFTSVGIEGDKPTGTAGNVGDGMVIIVDGKTMKVKHIVPAAKYVSPITGGGYEWNPQSIQKLEGKELSRVGQSNIPELNEDDIVIQMTNSAWSVFPTTSKEMIAKEGGDLWREISIDRTAIEEVLAKAKAAASPADSVLSAHAMGHSLLQAAADRALSKRVAHLALLERLEPHMKAALSKKMTRKENDNFTISVWINEIRQTDSRLAEDLLHYLAESQHDGIVYTSERPAGQFIPELKDKPFGDCCTIAVMRVPNQKVELVRALIENPKSYRLFPKIHALSAEDLDYAFDRLSREVYIERPDPKKGKKPSEIPAATKLTYSADQISEARQIIQAYKTHRQLLDAVESGNIDFIRNYCQGDNENQDKLIEVMTLGINDRIRDPDLKGVTALYIAAQYKQTAILRFIIDNAMYGRGRELLANQLLEKNKDGRNVLHTAAVIPDNVEVIATLCRTARTLTVYKVKVSQPEALANFVNQTEDQHGNTALHIAVRRGNFSNYQALIAAGIDVNARAINGNKLAIDLLPDCEPRSASIFMKSWIQQTDEGRAYLKKRYGIDNLSDLPEPFLDALIKVDLDLMLTAEPGSQLAALTGTLRLIAAATTDTTLAISFDPLRYINYQIITPRILAGDPHEETLKKAINSANTIKEPELKSLYLRAYILQLHKEHHPANRLAFDLYGTGAFLEKYPRLALDGMTALKTGSLDKFVLSKQIVRAMGYLALEEIAKRPPTPPKKGLLSIFAKEEKEPKENPAPAKIKAFLEDMHNVTSIDEIVKKINGLSDEGDVKGFKASTLSVLSQIAPPPAAVAKRA